jgi:hypothetical protein
MKNKLANTYLFFKLKKREDIGRSNLMATSLQTSQILKKPVEVVKGRILAV